VRSSLDADPRHRTSFQEMLESLDGDAASFDGVDTVLGISDAQRMDKDYVEELSSVFFEPQISSAMVREENSVSAYK
jgi:hypothetical protein